MTVRCHVNLKIGAVKNKFIFDFHFVGWAEQGSPYRPALTQDQPRYWPAITQGQPRSESTSGTTVVFKFEARIWDLQNKKQDL